MGVWNANRVSRRGRVRGPFRPPPRGGVMLSGGVGYRAGQPASPDKPVLATREDAHEAKQDPRRRLVWPECNGWAGASPEGVRSVWMVMA